MRRQWHRALLLDVSDLIYAQTMQTLMTTTALMTSTMSTDDAIPPPKLKQIQLPLHFIQKKRTHDLKTKRNKADAHKAAIHLYVIERQKPDGMLARQVSKKIEEK
jgi:hypothetical protein